MNGHTANKGLAAIFTAALVAALFVGGIGGYAAAKAGDSGSTTVATTVETNLPSRASRWDHEERTLDTTTARASRWDHEER